MLYKFKPKEGGTYRYCAKCGLPLDEMIYCDTEEDREIRKFYCRKCWKKMGEK